MPKLVKPKSKFAQGTPSVADFAGFPMAAIEGGVLNTAGGGIMELFQKLLGSKSGMVGTPVVNNIRRGWNMLDGANPVKGRVKSISHLPQISNIEHFQDASNAGMGFEDAIKTAAASSGKYAREAADALKKVFKSTRRSPSSNLPESDDQFAKYIKRFFNK